MGYVVLDRDEAAQIIRETKKEHYVYGLLRGSDESLFYVGKGSGDRIFDHVREINHNKSFNPIKINIIKKQLRNGIDIKYCLFAFFENVEDAFELEGALIEQYGRIDKNTGILANMTDGGWGGRGVLFSDERRNELSRRVSSYFSDDDNRKKASEAAVRRYEDPLERRKTSDAIRRYYEQDGAREKLSAAVSAACSSPEYREALSARNKEIMSDPELRERIRQSNLNTWLDPNVLAEHSERMRLLYEDQDLRKKVREANVAAWSNPELRARNSDIRKQWVADNPEKEAARIANAKVANALWRQSAEYEDAMKRSRQTHAQTIAVRTEIRTKCAKIITDYGINIIQPDGRSSVAAWEKFYSELIELVRDKEAA